MPDSSDGIGLGRVTAGRRDGGVWLRRAASGRAWGCCHLISHWLRSSGTVPSSEGEVGGHRLRMATRAAIRRRARGRSSAAVRTVSWSYLTGMNVASFPRWEVPGTVHPDQHIGASEWLIVGVGLSSRFDEGRLGFARSSSTYSRCRLCPLLWCRSAP